MDLSKIKNGYKNYDYEINAILALKVGENYLVIDENKEPYKIYCGGIACEMYQSINERGQMSYIKKKAKSANDFIVESVTGAKYKINLDVDKNVFYEAPIKNGVNIIVSMSLISYAICNGYKVLGCDVIKKMQQANVAKLIGAGVGVNCVFEERYSTTLIANDFLSAYFGLLNKNKIERFITNSNLVEYNDFDVSNLVEITPIDKMKLKMENGYDMVKEHKKDKEVCKQFKENVHRMLNEEDKSKLIK